MATKSTKPKRNPIKSAEQAEKERMGLTSYWSEESQLTQRTLIYVAGLLEKLLAQGKPRRRSEYQKHTTKILGAGGTIQEAAKLWQEKKQAGQTKGKMNDGNNL